MARATKLGTGLYWRGETIWARFSVNGELYRVSCRTGVERVAKERRERERQSVIDQVRYGKSGPVGWPRAVLEWTRNPPATVGARTLAGYAGSLQRLAPFLDGLDVQQIDHAKLTEIRIARLRVVSRRTVKTDLTAISSVLDVAIDNGWVETNAAHTYDRRKLRTPKHKIVLPLPAAIDRVVAAAPGAIADMTLFARETGMRQSEIIGLHRTDCDLSRWAATVQFGAKREKVRTVTLTPLAVAIIRRQPVFIGCPNLFWRGDGETYKFLDSQFCAITRRIERAAAKAGETFRRFRFHDLRHLNAVEYLRNRRGSIYDLQAELGHDSLKTTEIYLDFLTPDEARLAREGVAQNHPQHRKFDTAMEG